MQKRITVNLLLPVTITAIAEERNGEVAIISVDSAETPSTADIADASFGENLDAIDAAWAATDSKPE